MISRPGFSVSWDDLDKAFIYVFLSIKMEG